MIEYNIKKCPAYRQITITLEKAKYKDLILNARLDRCKIVKQQWDSIYNSYVTFNVQPSNSMGFKYTCVLEFSSEDYMEFYYYDLTSKLDLINRLEGCLELEYEGSNNK